mgnify:CR=1 FL=1
MSNLIALTPENYYSQEANMQYVSASQYKDFNGTTGKLGCEAYAMAKLRGEVEEVSTTPLLVGSYVDAYFEGTLPTFSAQHPEIFSSRGKTAGELKAEYKQASAMIDRAEKDKVFMQYMAGDKQVIMTGEINGIPVKIKIDSCDGKRITDLKTVKSVTETFYAKDLGQRLNFRVIAEYVETEEQRDQLLAMGCDTFQGYLYYKDMPVENLVGILKNENKDRTGQSSRRR